MATPYESELAREFTQRGLSRREMLRIGARLGLTSTSLATILTLSGHGAVASGHAGQPAAAMRAQGSIFDPQEGADGPWPQTAVPELTSSVTLAVAHAWDATFM